MRPPSQFITPSDPAPAARPRLLRMLPLAVVVLITASAFAFGWHRQLSLEALLQHRASIESFIAANGIGAIACYVALYIAVVALSIPCAAIMTVSGGLLFGTLIGGVAAVFAATVGATIIFLIARSAIGEWLMRRAGARAARIAAGFRADCFSYLLFLRLVPLFPFWLVNLVPALAGVRLGPFLAATAVGIAPVAFVGAFFGASLDHAIASQEASYRDCLAAGSAACHLDFSIAALMTPRMIAALVVLGAIALLPVIVRHVRTRVRPI